MAEIQVPCANQECDSVEIEIIKSNVLLQGFKHDLKCDYCHTPFSLLTCIDSVKIPKEIKS